MVGKQSGTMQWPIGYTTTVTAPYFLCIQKDWGAVCRGIRAGVQWYKKEQDLYINQLELLAIKFSHLDNCQNVENVSYTYPGRQHESLELFAENGRDKESRTNADLKGNLGVSTWEGDHNYCRAFTRESQLQGRLGISAPERFLRMETVPSNFRQNMPIFGGRNQK